jgi:hypothetical protein
MANTVMTQNEIIDNEAPIFECAKSFRQEANYLMLGLAKDYNFSLDKGALFAKEVYAHKYKNKGIFREEWEYHFHGAECLFENLKTGQIIELIYTNKPEFGFLDGYFFYNYMLTTDRYKNLARWFTNYLNVWTAIEDLADRKILTRMPGTNTNRNIIAL